MGLQSISVGGRNISVHPGTRGATDQTEPGSLLLIVQMQGARIFPDNSMNYGGNDGTGSGYTSLNNVGTFEFAIVQEITENWIFLQSPLQHDYQVQNGDDGSSKFQIVTVRRCTEAIMVGNITCANWNGETGGILALDVANQLETQRNTIDCTGTGYRGGHGIDFRGGSNLNNSFAFVTSNSFPSTTRFLDRPGGGDQLKGEGIAGTPLICIDKDSNDYNATRQGYPGGDFSRGAPGNAGGGANDHNPGGGGGALAGNGGSGGLTPLNVEVFGFGGASIDVNWPSRLIMGIYIYGIRVILVNIDSRRRRRSRTY